MLPFIRTTDPPELVDWLNELATEQSAQQSAGALIEQGKRARPRFPWTLYIGKDLATVDSACQEHLLHHFSARFPAEWQIAIARHEESQYSDVIYSLESGFMDQRNEDVIFLSGGILIGQFRISRIDEEVSRFTVTNTGKKDKRLVALFAGFFARWTQELNLLEQETKQRETSPSCDELLSDKPWMLLPDVGWDREAVERWWRQEPAEQIAAACDVTSKSIVNRLSVLRKQYPKLVPLKKDLPEILAERARRARLG